MSSDWEIEDVFLFHAGRIVIVVNMPVGIRQALPVRAAIITGDAQPEEIVIRSERMPDPAHPHRRSFETWDHVDANRCRTSPSWLRMYPGPG